MSNDFNLGVSEFPKPFSLIPRPQPMLPAAAAQPLPAFSAVYVQLLLAQPAVAAVLSLLQRRAQQDHP